MNLIASAKGRDALHEVVAFVRTAYASVLRITLLLSTNLCMLPFISWYRLLGLSENEAGISTASVAVVAVAILASIPLAIASKIQLGLGQGDKVFRWQALGQILTAASVIMLARLGAPLPTIVAGSTLLPLITLLFNTIQLHRALKEAGTTNIWVGTTEIDNGDVARIEADLIETLNTSANVQRPAPSSGLQDATVSVVQQFKAEMYRHRPKPKTSKAGTLQSQAIDAPPTETRPA